MWREISSNELLGMEFGVGLGSAFRGMGFETFRLPLGAGGLGFGKFPPNG